MVKLSRLLMMGLVVCAVMVVAGLNAQAASVYDAIDNEWIDEVTPIIFEDNDFGLWIDTDGKGTLNSGDLIIGIIRIQEISNGGSAVGGTNGIRDVPPTTGTAIGAGTAYNELTAVFGAQITSSSPYTDTTGDSVWSLAPISGGSVTFSASLFSGLTTDWTYTFNTAGNMIDLWEDSGKDFDENDPSTAGNGTFSGGLGMTAAASANPNSGSNSAGEFWFVEDNSGTPLPDDFQMNLTMTDPLSSSGGFPNLFGWSLLPNDITSGGDAFLPGSALNFGSGNDMFASGGFISGTGGWTFASDGDFKVLFAPLPTAVWPAMLLLGALGLVRRARRKTA